MGVDLKDLFTTDRLLQPMVILHPLLDSIGVLVCMCTQSRLFLFPMFTSQEEEASIPYPLHYGYCCCAHDWTCVAN